MSATATRIIAILLLFGALPLGIAEAQEDYSLADDQAQPSPAQAAPVYSQQQIDQLVAPIALYPDPLVSSILMASTYPLEVVEAYRWLQQPDNAELQGDELAEALQQQPWEPSVKSLAASPQMLKTLNDNLQWTEQLGDAFLGQQAAVSASIQQLRQQAQEAGSLTSTPQQTVADSGGAIEIVPANPQIIYVPTYNPAVVYGTWSYPAYPPYYFNGIGYSGAIIGFGAGFAVVDGLWGWNHWDWAHHRIDIDNRRYAALNFGRAPPVPGVWHHDPDHRRGVPYHDAVTRAQFQDTNAIAARRAYRGYQPAAEGRAGSAAAPARFGPAKPAVTPPARQAATPRAAAAPARVRPDVSPRFSAAPVVRSPAPVFESFSAHPDTHAQSARGAQSRSSMPAPAAPPPGQPSDKLKPRGDNEHSR